MPSKILELAAVYTGQRPAVVFELRAEAGQARGSIVRVAERLGINSETLRNWVERTEIDGGQRPGTASDEKKRIVRRPAYHDAL